MRVETSPEDIHGMHAAEGILTTRGGMTSHAAVVARGMGKPCVSGAGTLRVDYRAQSMTAGGVTLKKGDILTLDANSAHKTGKVTTGRVCIDNNSTADVVEDTVIRDRKHLGEDGVFLPIIAINKRTGQVEGQPEITTRGFVADDPDLLRNARDIVSRTLEMSSAEERRDYGVMKDKIRGDLKRFIQKNANRRPLIMPIILEL